MMGISSPSAQLARQPFQPAVVKAGDWMADSHTSPAQVAAAGCHHCPGLVTFVLLVAAGLLGFALVAASLDAAPLKATARTPGLSYEQSSVCSIFICSKGSS